MKFLLFDVGCIECGEESDVLGLFDTKEEAETEREKWSKVGWRGGQHSYEVFEIPEDINEQGAKYLESAKKESGN